MINLNTKTGRADMNKKNENSLESYSIYKDFSTLENLFDPEKIYNLEKLELHNNDFLQNEEIEKIVSLKNMKKIEYFIEYMKNKNNTIENISLN